MTNTTRITCANCGDKGKEIFWPGGEVEIFGAGKKFVSSYRGVDRENGKVCITTPGNERRA